jgi:hypothetical protein
MSGPIYHILLLGSTFRYQAPWNNYADDPENISVSIAKASAGKAPIKAIGIENNTTKG